MANFQSITPVKLGQAAITTGVTTLHTVGASSRALLKDIDVVNTGSAAATFDVYLVPTGGSAGTSNALFYQQTVLPKQNVQWSGTQVLNAGDTIQIKASATGITIIASGGEAV